MKRSEYMKAITGKSAEERTRLYREYYGQFVNESIRQYVKQRIGMQALLASTDKHLNDIPLHKWDGMNEVIRGMVNRALWIENHDGHKDRGFYWSISCGVCVAKEAARQLIEREKQ